MPSIILLVKVSRTWQVINLPITTYSIVALSQLPRVPFTINSILMDLSHSTYEPSANVTNMAGIFTSHIFNYSTILLCKKLSVAAESVKAVHTL